MTAVSADGAYPDRFLRSATCADIRTPGQLSMEPVRIAGRVMRIRDLGKLTFLHLQDHTGQVQVMVRPNEMGGTYNDFTEGVGTGDIVSFSGQPTTTRTGEPTLVAEEFEVLAKAVQKLPDKFHGVVDPEVRYRKRHLEILTDPDVMERFRVRSRAVRSLRAVLEGAGFEEMVTPVLQPNPSGANAEPFRTYHEGLGRELFLRIAPETYLKRLLVAGFDRVFEIGPCFRNEGISRDHLQEFTMLEYYAGGWNMWDNLQFFRGLMARVAQDALGSTVIMVSGEPFDLAGPWEVVEFAEAVEADCGIDLMKFDDVNALIEEVRRHGIDIGDVSGAGLGTVMDKLYKAVTRPRLITPTVVVHQPSDLSPLARPNDRNPSVVDQFQLVAGGVEVCKCYSELVDPALQREKLREQAQANAGGDPEAMVMDEAYLEAMEHGMPPCSGLGIGIDRLTAFLLDIDNLKETVLYPL